MGGLSKKSALIMKAMLALFVFLYIFPTLSFSGQPDQPQLDAVKQLLAETEQRVKSTGVDEPKAIAENALNLWDIPAFQNIAKGANSLWEGAFDKIDDSAPSENEKMILVLACQGLDRDSYMRFLDKATALCEQGKLSKDALYAAFFPQVRLQHILEADYRNSRVIDLCERAKRIWADDPEKREMVDAVLRGNTGTALIQRENHMAVLGLLVIVLAVIGIFAWKRSRRNVPSTPA
jgi:hypothetical protein